MEQGVSISISGLEGKTILGNSAGQTKASTASSGFSAILSQKISSSQTTTLSAKSPLVSRFELNAALAGTSLLNSLGWSGAASTQSSTAYRHQYQSLTGKYGQDDSDGEYEVEPLGEALSTYDGSYFRAEIELSESEQVGGNIEQFHFAHIIEKDGTYYAYFIDHSQGSENDVGLATSSDGVNFEYQGKVLTKGESGIDAAQASFPSVQYDSETQTWYMLYEAKADYDDLNTVCLATSSDGVNWSKQGAVISPGDGGEFSQVDVGTPTLLKEDGTWHVYFHGLASDGRVRIGHASGTDLQNLSVDQGAILDVDDSGLESGTVGARSNVVKIGDYYYMAYEACTAVTQFEGAQWGTNLARATSLDGEWEKLDGELLENTETGMGMDGPELLVQDDKLYLYYRYGGNSTARVEISGLEASGGYAVAHQA